jgi:hypothetical protein
LEIFEQSLHFPHQDEPARFTDVLVDFLATTEPAVSNRALLRQRLVSGGLGGTDGPDTGRPLPAARDGQPEPEPVSREPT